MRLNKSKLKELISEVLSEEPADDPTKLKTGAMTGGQFVTKGREQRVDADAGEQASSTLLKYINLAVAEATKGVKQ